MASIKKFSTEVQPAGAREIVRGPLTVKGTDKFFCIRVHGPDGQAYGLFMFPHDVEPLVKQMQEYVNWRKK